MFYDIKLRSNFNAHLAQRSKKCEKNSNKDDEAKAKRKNS